MVHKKASATKDVFQMEPEELRAVRERRLCKQIELCYNYGKAYRAMFDREGLTPNDIQTLEDLIKLPLTYKTDYMKDPESYRLRFPNDAPVSPYERVLWDVTYTTGTTLGKPSPFYNTTHDYMAILDALRGMCEIGNLTSDDTVANIFPVSVVPHIGYLRAKDFPSTVGARSFATLTGATYPDYPINRSLDEALSLVERNRATVLVGIASYVRRMIMRAEEVGADLSSVRQCQVLGEGAPAGMRDDIRRRLRKLGASESVFINNGYGFTELQGSCVECCEFSGNHIPAPDQFYFEIVDEKDGTPVPEGEEGLILLTHLDRRGTVLLRYVVGDIASFSEEPCPHCGRRGGRITGQPVRTHDLINLKGTLINPRILTEALAGIYGIEEYQIVLGKEDPTDPYSLDRMTVRVALAEGVDRATTGREVALTVKNATEVSATIEFVQKTDIFDPAKSLKCLRVVDERPTGTAMPVQE